MTHALLCELTSLKIVINHFNKDNLILALRTKCSLIIGLLGIRILLMNTYMGRKHSCPFKALGDFE